MEHIFPPLKRLGQEDCQEVEAPLAYIIELQAKHTYSEILSQQHKNQNKADFHLGDTGHEPVWG